MNGNLKKKRFINEVTLLTLFDFFIKFNCLLSLTGTNILQIVFVL